ncbi:hypothetical protein SALBM135S_01367 [Streptomyces alboniger]
MHRRTRPALLLALAVLLSGCGSAPADGDVPSSAGKPFWRAEFDGAAATRPSGTSWNTETGNRDAEGWGNNELQYYTDDPANSALDGSGHLVISARPAPPGPGSRATRAPTAPGRRPA